MRQSGKYWIRGLLVTKGSVVGPTIERDLTYFSCTDCSRTGSSPPVLKAASRVSEKFKAIVLILVSKVINSKPSVGMS